MTENEKQINNLKTRVTVVEAENKNLKEEVSVVKSKFDKLLFWLLATAAGVIVSNVGIIVTLLMNGGL